MIDTLSIARNLAAAGVEQKQAEAQAKAIAGAIRSEDIAALREHVDSQFSAIKWMIGLLAGLVTAALAIFVPLAIG